MGGLITNITNTTTPLKPYLLYTNATVINDTRNYTHILLNGPGLASYSLSALKNAITNGYYFATNYTSDYLGQAQGSVNQVSNYGSASFNLLNRKVASCNGVTSTIITNKGYNAPIQLTITGWFLSNKSTGNYQFPIDSNPEANWRIGFNSAGNIYFDPGSHNDVSLSNTNIKFNKWYFVALSAQNSGTNTIWTFYLDGISIGSGSVGSNIQAINNLSLCDYAYTFTGQLANTQVYNTSLSSLQISRLYAEGISSMPISNAGLAGWYPLDGNANDYSGNGNNGVSTNVIYGGLSNYTLNMLSDAPITTFGSGKAYFNGYSSYITGNSYAFPITAAAWIYPTNLQSPHLKVIMELDGNQPSSSGQGESYQFFIVPKGSGYCGGIAGTLFLWNNSAATCTNLIAPLNKWSFAAFTANTSFMKVFLNGQTYIYPVTLASANPSNKIFLVGEQGGNRYFNGSIKNIQIYNASFNESELKTLYKSGMNAGPINNTNLVAWYPLDGNANDYSGNGNNGVPTAVSFNSLSNNPTSNLVEGVLNCANINACSNSTLQKLYLNPLPLAYAGKGFMNETTALELPYGGISDVANFNGSGYITIPHSSSYAVNTIFSISWWFNSAHSSTTNFDSEMLSSRQPTDTTFDMQLIGGTSPELHGDIGTGTGTWLSTSVNYGFSFNQSQWYNVVTVFSSTGWSIFLNGKNVSSGTYSGTPSLLDSNSYLDIGSGFDGSIADAQIYNVALSSAQIQDLYLNNTVSGATPVAYWPLSTGLNGLLNQTPDVINGNTGYLYSGSGQCTVAEVADGTCGVEYVQP
jgi:hypothetical protein